MNSTNYVLADSTGEIVAHGTCHKDDLALQGRDGCTLVEGAGNPRRHYVRSGKIVAYTDEQANSKAAVKPDAHWDNALMGWASGLTEAERLARLAGSVRAQRTQRLIHSDWVVTKAAEEGQPAPAPWRAYRDALRGVPEQPGFPETIEWPIEPQ